MLWTVVPVVLLAVIGAFVFCELPGIADAPTAAAADETTITVEGHQFYWLFRYPNGAVSVNEMVAPADTGRARDVTVGLDDVNHSWWVPRPRRQDRRDPRPRQPDLVQGARRRPTSRAAPSSAGSSTP